MRMQRIKKDETLRELFILDTGITGIFNGFWIPLD
jgi:hypothetical protein